MADTKITALTALTAADPANDVIPIVDVSDTSMAASGTTKKISVNNILGASGTATLASATITGDLTVDTSTLKVDSTNNRVGINNATPGVALHIGTTSGTNRLAINTAVTSGGDIQMRRGSFIGFSNAADGANSEYLFANGGALEFGIAATTAVTIDASRNVGIGVTPSSWSNPYKCVQLSGGSLSVYPTTDLYISQNAYNSGGWKRVAAGYASQYIQTNSEHRFLIAGTSPTVDSAITFTQAMTLDAGGYLLLGTTDTTFTSGAGYKFGPGATPSNGQVGASSSNGDLTLRVYSTGAAAYRFYVGYGGTVFATNATISAISDSRFKENVQDIDVGLSAILALKPRKFDWKAGKGKDIKGDRGFIAQEFETVFPNLIDEWADPAPEGEAPYKSVRADLIPVLVKAIQELTARVQTLEAR